ncbi:MAG: exopolysaccharide biosynthesis polyprenyl glycosylphosphotransferase [Gammaproteobacteria bacterium]
MPTSPGSRSKLLPLLDWFLIALAGFAAYAIRFGRLDTPDHYFLTILLGAFITVVMLGMNRAYVNLDLGFGIALRRLVVPLLIGFLLVAMLGVMSKSSNLYSRIWIGYWIPLALAAVLASRGILAGLARSPTMQKLFARHLVLVLPERDAARRAAELGEQLAPWYHVIGVFSVPSDPPRGDEATLEKPLLNQGSVHQLLDWSRERRIDDIILVPPLDWSQPQVTELLQPMQQIPANLYLGPLPMLASFPGAQRMDLADHPMMLMAHEPLDASQRLFKSVQDWLLAALALLISLPAMMVIALAIKLDSRGPVLFSQKRYGFRREVITVYKFRTMRHADDDPQVKQASRDDPRTTRVGRTLRRLSLDELPQLLNVLNGTMALTGPRPHALPHDDHFGGRIDRYLGRHKVKPGITGWAQAHGFRGEIREPADMQRRLEHDLYYVENWSPLLDLEILVRTVFIVLTGRNAY